MNTMTTMIFINGEPVAIVGATRFYVTPSLAALAEPVERAAIIDLCEAMTGMRDYGPAEAFEPRRAGTD